MKTHALKVPSEAANTGLGSKFSDWLAKSAASHADLPGVSSLFVKRDGVMTLDATCAVRLIRTGLLASFIWELVPLLGLSTKEELLQVISASDTSLRRWASEDKLLPTPMAEMILRTMQLQLIACDVFGSIDLARAWLRKPHPMLDGLAPAEFSDNQFGAAQVRGILAALKYAGVV